jgi:hypothetical protein
MPKPPRFSPWWLAFPVILLLVATLFALVGTAVLPPPPTAPLGASTAQHLFAGWLSDATATQEVATISVPAVAPAGNGSAWVMAVSAGTCDFTQVGWAWYPTTFGGPRVFASTQLCGYPGQWSFGPALAPGGSVTVDIARHGTSYADEVNEGGAWQTIAVARFTDGPVWATQVENYGPLPHVCFTARLQFAGTWADLPSGCWG